MADLATRLETRLRWVRSWSDTEQLMKEAEATDAYAVCPRPEGQGDRPVHKGVEYWQAYGLDDAEENFGAAREAAKDTLRIAREAEGRRGRGKQKAEELQAGPS